MRKLQIESRHKVTRCPQVAFLLPAWEKIQHYIGFLTEEISGLGDVERIGDDFLVTDVYLLKQVDDIGETELDQIAIGRLIGERIARGEDTSKMKLWFHSHGDGAVYWSPHLDEPTIDGFRNEFMISLVVNRQGLWKCRIDLYTPVRLTVDNVPISIVVQESSELREKCLAEFKRTVKVRSSSLLLGIKRRPKPQEGSGRIHIPFDFNIFDDE
jgi:hypothetical protein